MKIYVDLDHVDITEYTQVESGEYNTNKINFIFTPEYKDLVKVAIFGCKLDTDEPKFYKIYLSDDSCYLPLEVTTTSDVISIGVYAFNVENGELKLRYSPTPVKTIVYEGSFREEAENSSSPTPTEIEQIMSRIISLEELTSDLDTRVEALEAKACNVDELNTRVDTLEDDVEGISGRLDTAESDIDELEGDIANTYSKTEVDTLLGTKVDTTTYTTGQAAQDEKIAKAELILSQLPKVTGEGTNISLSPTIEYDLEVESYKGDTEQDTLTGKNLFNITTKKDYYWLYTNGGIGTSTDPNIVSDFIPTTSGQQYVISGIPAGMSLRVCSYSTTDVSSFVSTLINNVRDVKTFTANSNYIVFAIGSGNAVALTELQMEKGSTATSYEPYCGGIQAPNPNYEIPVQVVTGTQEVTISNSDNTESQTYTLHLGDLELAKIGAAQDYIYYNNGKWYKYGAISKVRLLSTTQTWVKNATNVTGKYRYLTEAFKTIIVKPSANNVVGNILSNYYTKQVAGTNGSYGANQGISIDNAGGLYINDDRYLDDLNGWKTWLDSIECYFYYCLLTPTTIEITNETLLSDLEYIRTHSMSYSGTTNISSSGNIPVIISASALKQLS